jgi:hypothetical protein
VTACERLVVQEEHGHDGPVTSTRRSSRQMLTFEPVGTTGQCTSRCRTPLDSPVDFGERRHAVSRLPGGPAATLVDVVDFYNTRFNLGLTVREKADLIAFLRTL